MGSFVCIFQLSGNGGGEMVAVMVRWWLW